jgi:primosomal protein N''
MGKPGAVKTASTPLAAFHTRRSETSQYPEEKKKTLIPLVAASEQGRAQTAPHFCSELISKLKSQISK